MRENKEGSELNEDVGEEINKLVFDSERSRGEMLFNDIYFACL